MSGDVQPRKRKDKKRKKDELGVEEPRGTAAALGEGDVFMHSYSDHGTGGHWCAKIIFFSLLAILITLIGLIILENRGLSELEANAVESRYSGVLEGWLEDAPDDDHHDKHTLELKHPDGDEDDLDHYGEHDLEQDDEEHDDHDEEEDDGTNEDDEEEDEEQGDDEQNELEDEDEENELDEDGDGQNEDDDERNINEDQDEQNEDEDDEDEQSEDEDDEDEQNEDEDDKDEQNNEEDDERELYDEDNEDEDEDEHFDTREVDEEDEDEENDDEDEQSEDKDEDEEQADGHADDEDEDEHHAEDEEDEDDEVEVEKIEKEVLEEPISTELPALPEEDDDDDDDGKDDDKDDDDSEEAESPDDVNDDDDDDDDDGDDNDAADDDGDGDDFLEADDEPGERITAPAGKPFVEVEEDDTSSEKPPDTLEEEEEYERQQEELRREEEQSSNMWLKLSVGGALLAATFTVMRRAAAPSDEDPEEREVREETPVDRRMTLIPEDAPRPVLTKKSVEEVKKVSPFVSTPPPVKQDEEEEEVEEPEEIDEEIEEIDEPVEETKGAEKYKELYSDEEEEEEEIVVPKKEAPKFIAPPPPEPEPEPDDEVPDDVEIIDDEQLEEELEEEEDISDVDDTELLSRLEAKYGRLPEPERPGQKHKDGGNSVEDEWPGEPSDAYWRQQLDAAERELRQGGWSSAVSRAGAPQLKNSGRARYIIAKGLDRQAEAKRDNKLLSQAILAYLELLKMNENLSDKKLLKVANRALDRIQFRGSYTTAEPVYRLLIRRFPNQPEYRNNLTISFLMANKADLAEQVLRETLKLWPDDRVALAHLGFVLKTQQNKLEEAVKAFEKALDGDKGPACEPRFYYHYGDALLLLRRYTEAHEVHRRGAKFGHFLSAAQRSLYNVPRLEGKPWWKVEDTPYLRLAKALEKSWKDILKEGEAAKALYEKEREGLKEKGEWSQMDLFVRGREIPERCKNARITCSIVKSEPAAAGCRRGQVKFSAMEAGTHVRPHVGPTNCRLRMHLGLSNTKDTYIRVDQEIRQWQEGKVMLFDDSFEHEVWHNGTGKRLVLIVDVWHPHLTPAERRTLPAI